MKKTRASLRTLLRRRRRAVMKARLGYRPMITADRYGWRWWWPVNLLLMNRRGNQRKPRPTWRGPDQVELHLVDPKRINLYRD
ncbi:MAG: hypothetical protein AB7S57_19615 [Acetobacteraceae bacterium]